MTNKKLSTMLNAETVKYTTAQKINDLLEAAAKEAGLKGDDAEEYKTEIMNLVCEDDE